MPVELTVLSLSVALILVTLSLIYVLWKYQALSYQRRVEAELYAFSYLQRNKMLNDILKKVLDRKVEDVYQHLSERNKTKEESC